MNRVRVLIDARELSGDAARSGIGTYIRNLLTSLGEIDGLDVRALATAEVSLPQGVSQVPIRRLTKSGRRAVIEHSTLLPFDLRRPQASADVFHNPLFHAPPAVPGRWIQTLHDVIPLVDDDPDHDVLRKRWQRFGPRYRKAAAVIAISSHAADEGIRVLGLDHRRVHVAHHGIDPAFRRTDHETGTDPPYLLVVSQFSKRKQFEHAFQVLGELAEAGYPHRLRVAGWVPDRGKPQLDALLQAAARPDRIEILGYVEDLPELYRGAAVVLVTSRYEGFGFTALEAMASGTPVVSYRNSSLTEVVGEGGILVRDGDVHEMVSAVRELLDSESCRAKWVVRGLEWSRRFTWEASARATADVYAEVAGRR